ncbi:MAG: hypothetical protein L0Y73_06755, partial [Candidatus Aminicenantes bacterium]|nr:hypothetical protein [Candidatus Aminicenantes bacterium]
SGCVRLIPVNYPAVCSFHVSYNDTTQTGKGQIRRSRGAFLLRVHAPRALDELAQWLTAGVP